MMRKQFILFFLIFLVHCEQKLSTEEIFYNSGCLKFKVELKNGLCHGISHEYYENGKLRSTQNWINGEPNGEGKHYYQDGKLRLILNWKMGKAHGPRKEFYQSGEIKSEGEFLNNHQIGIHKFYFESGRIMEADYYDSLGNELDFEKYDSLGNLREDKKVALTHLDKDTVKVGEEIILTGHLGNNFHKVNMIIGEKYNQEGFLEDTFAIVYPGSGIDGCEYSHTSDKIGEQFLVGYVQEIIQMPDSSIAVQLFPFQQRFFVTD